MWFTKSCTIAGFSVINSSRTVSTQQMYLGHLSRVMRKGRAYPARCAAAPKGSPVQ
jgi:hypothetical protein